MHVSWWEVLFGVVLIWTVILEWRSAQPKARGQREVLKGGAGSHRHAEAFAKQRRSYQRKMWWQLPFGLAFLLLGMIIGFRGDWGTAAFAIATALWAIASGALGFVCLRILGPPAANFGQPDGELTEFEPPPASGGGPEQRV